MLRNELRNRPATIVGLSLVLAVVPACSATAGHGLLRRPTRGAVIQPATPRPYYAYRPAYPLPGTRPLFLSNYAGANYPSVAPTAAVTPTEFRAITGRPPTPRWFGLGKGW